MTINTTELMNNLEPGESFTRIKRVSVHLYSPGEVQSFCRSAQSSLIALAARIDKKKFVVERIDAFTNSREHIVYGVVCTRIK